MAKLGEPLNSVVGVAGDTVGADGFKEGFKMTAETSKILLPLAPVLGAYEAFFQAAVPNIYRDTLGPKSNGDEHRRSGKVQLAGIIVDTLGLAAVGAEIFVAKQPGVAVAVKGALNAAVGAGIKIYDARQERRSAKA